MSKLRFLLLATLLLPCAAPAAWAQSAVVKKNVNLRRDPSSSHPEIRLLLPPEELTLLDTAKTNNYFHVVVVESSDTGWVYAPNVTVVIDPVTTLTAIATAVDPDWPKPPPVVGIFHSPVQNLTCAANGDPGGDTGTNRLKNRTDSPASYHAVALEAIRDLPYPATTQKSRLDWPPESLAVVLRMEGPPVQVVGYLVAVKTEGSETTNCFMTRVSETDWHMAITVEVGQGEEESVVVETTPRIRINHAKWTRGRLTPWIDGSRPVRISGWLMFDPFHRNHLGTFRKTLWEVHPITKIEVWQDDAWVDLDDLPS
jgi:hypothetical protein